MLARAIVLVEVDAVGEVVLLTVERTILRSREVAVVAAQIAIAFGLKTIGAVVEAVVFAVRQFTTLSGLPHVHGRGNIETPAASASAPASIWSLRIADPPGHDTSADILPRYAICVADPNEALFMQRAEVNWSSGPAALRSAKNCLTSAKGTDFLIGTSPCCKAVVPSAYTRKRYPARFVEPELTISASVGTVGTRRYAGAEGVGAGTGP